MKNPSLLAAFAVALLLSPTPLFAQETAPARKDPLQDVVTELVKKGFNTFLMAMRKTDLINTVGNGNYTLIAPTDVAFRELPKAQLDALLADKDKLTSFLSHHIAEGKHSTADLKAKPAKTLAGSEVSLKVVDGKLKAGPATVVRPDLPATNGVIHGIDKFLQQP